MSITTLSCLVKWEQHSHRGETRSSQWMGLSTLIVLSLFSPGSTWVNSYGFSEDLCDSKLRNLMLSNNQSCIIQDYYISKKQFWKQVTPFSVLVSLSLVCKVLVSHSLTVITSLVLLVWKFLSFEQSKFRNQHTFSITVSAPHCFAVLTDTVHDSV